MIYSVANIKKDKNKNTVFEVVKDIDENVYNKIKISMNDLKMFTQVKHFLDMVIKNGLILQNYIKKIETANNEGELKKIDSKKIGDTANKYIYDYSSTFGTFLDIIEKYLYKKDKEKAKKFHKEVVQNIHLKEDVYKFWDGMRNYVVHYDVPFSSVVVSFSGVKIVCSKEHLLEYSKWNHAKSFIENLDDNVDIYSLVEPMNIIIYRIYFEYLYFISEYLIKMTEFMNQLTKDFQSNFPIIISYESIEELKKGKLSAYPLGLTELYGALKELEHHPKINITWKS